MQNHGRTTVFEFLDDLIVYRNLIPLDSRLPALSEIRRLEGLPGDGVPRKNEPEYGRVIAPLLRMARSLDAPATPIRHVLYVGDTRMSDGAAFTHTCRAGGWTGLAFICSERLEPTRVDVLVQDEGAICLANRWHALDGLDDLCEERDLRIDEHTAVILDLDKATIGARGRNDRVIDQARLEAMYRTIEGLVGRTFDPQRFQDAYGRLNRPEFHPFTADNQDYVAYVCLMVSCGLYDAGELVDRVHRGSMVDFAQFIAEVDRLDGQLPASLRAVHGEFHARVREGDPTPFKAFRRSEYESTVRRMGCLGDDVPAPDRLAEEIVITQEVRQAALRWRARGALLFGLSDKPDEAAVPSDALAAKGYLPIHRIETHVVGGDL